MIICGTGHRPNKLGGYGIAAQVKLLNLASGWLGDVRPDKVISGMALGWDYALAASAFELDIPFIAAVPFEGQERMWPSESQANYRTLLKAAEQVVYVSSADYAPWKMQVRNQWMVDNCDSVLALWDGSSGGTGNCVAYANKVGRPVINLWEDFNT